MDFIFFLLVAVAEAWEVASLAVFCAEAAVLRADKVRVVLPGNTTNALKCGAPGLDPIS